MRRTLLTLLPKWALSRTTGMLTGIPLPGFLRRPLLGWFAARYGANLEEMQGELRDYRSFAAFFQRPLKRGARPLGPEGELLSPCDGKVVTAGPVGRGPDGSPWIPQVKGQDYSLAELLGDSSLADELAEGDQLTVYLAPGDYHRVHVPFTGTIGEIREIPGTLFPVNPPAVRCITRLYLRNARVVFPIRGEGGGVGAVVMVGALNVGRIDGSVAPGQRVAAGDELGRFGFGSSVVVVWQGLAPGWGPERPAPAGETRLWMGRAAHDHT